MFNKNIVFYLPCSSIFYVFFTFFIYTNSYAQFVLPQDAFKFKAYQQYQANNIASSINVVFNISKNHILYKHKFEFFVDDTNVKLSKPIFPESLTKFDSNFNKQVDFYRKEVKIILPVIQANVPFTLKVMAQGCAENGICYPHTAYYQRIIPVNKVNQQMQPPRPQFSFLSNTSEIPIIMPYKSAGLPITRISMSRNHQNKYNNNINTNNIEGDLNFNMNNNKNTAIKKDHSKLYWLFIFICILCTSIISHPMFNQEE